MQDSKKAFIYVVDDDNEMRAMLKDYLEGEGYEIHPFSLAQQAIDKLKEPNQRHPDLIISDIRMPNMTGLEFCQKAKELHPEIPFVLITAFGSIETAIEGIKQGAFDYITKPFKLAELNITIERAIRYDQLQKENSFLKEEIKGQWKLDKLIGKSSAMRSVFDLIQRVSHASANILITGESGTGKEMVAQAIHKLGPRSQKAFVAINCTAIPENLLESELFGHAKGSFTGAHARKKGLFEEADGGTLFLDEIGDMDLALQAKLLRVLQEKKIRPVGDNVVRDIDVRVIAATHKDLKARMKEGLFREDLYYRLSVIPIVIPPLRHRTEDIPLLAEYFLKKYSALNSSKVMGLSNSAMQKLLSLPWEGNVRELENLMERVVVMTNKPLVEAEDIPTNEDSTSEQFFGKAIQDYPSLENLEKRYIQFILDKTAGRKEKAAQLLGINRRTLYRKEREYGFVGAHESESESNFEPEPQTPAGI